MQEIYKSSISIEMKRRLKKLYGLLLLCLLPFAVNAQTMDVSDLEKLEQGKFRYAEGRIQVTVDDTTTPAFIEKDFGSLGYSVNSFNITPLKGFGKGVLPEGMADSLRNHPFVKEVLVQKPVLSEGYEQRILENEEFSAAQKDSLLKQIRQSLMQTSLVVIFRMEVNREMAEELLPLTAGFPLELEQAQTRSVIVETESGKEAEVIEVLDKKKYVKYGALIGIIED